MTAETHGQRRVTSVRLVALIGAITMLVFGGGFAAAAFTFTSHAVTSTQGATSVTMASTAWTGQSIYAGFNGSASCTTSSVGSPVAVSGSAPVSIYIGVQSTPACSGGAFVEELIFTASVPASQSAAADTFTVSSSSSVGASSVQNVYVSVSSTTAYSAQLNLYLEYGSAAPSSITSIGVVINGAF